MRAQAEGEGFRSFVKEYFLKNDDLEKRHDAL